MALHATSRAFLICGILAAFVIIPSYLSVEAQAPAQRPADRPVQGATTTKPPKGQAPAAVETQRQQDNRALRLQEIKDLPPKSKRFALVVGVDEYQDEQISPLSGAGNDAKSLADALVRYAGFPADQVILLSSDQPRQRQPNRGNILQYLSNLRGVVPQDGLLVVSFAGHGIERDGRGFLCPSDARIGGSITLLESTAVAVDTVREWIRETGVQQVLIILDACRNDPSGRGDTENRLTDSFARRFNFDVRNKEVTAFATLYATDVGHLAYEYKEKKQGYFTWVLVEGLKGGAANEKGEVTLGRLVKYLQEQVPKRVRLDLGQEKSQKPYATVGGYNADELVISITVRASIENSVVAGIDPAAIEVEFWNSIKNSSDVDDLKAYLERYPNGTFAALARNKVRQLEAKTAVGLGELRLRNVEFEVVTVDANGSEISNKKAHAQAFIEYEEGVALELVQIPGGAFVMGSNDGDASEKPPHQVTVAPFYIGRYEVTQKQWRTVAGLPKVARDLKPKPSSNDSDDFPIEQVSWYDAVEFCARLSQATGRNYRLPTEAEWEYACRAGTTTPFAFGQSLTPRLANYASATNADEHHFGIWPVGSGGYGSSAYDSNGAPNAFGLYDMHGNVFEWCLDHWHNSYDGAPVNGRSWETGGDARYRVLRGGSYDSAAIQCRSSFRQSKSADANDRLYGFRVVADVR